MKFVDFLKLCATALACLMVFSTVWGTATVFVTGVGNVVQYAILLMGATVGPLAIYFTRSSWVIIVGALKKL